MTIKEGHLSWGSKRPAGWVLCHNDIRHPDPNWPHGLNGFRAFYSPPSEGFVECPCGWRPDRGVHYATIGHVSTYKVKRGSNRSATGRSKRVRKARLKR
jgi:hypothetical protein